MVHRKPRILIAGEFSAGKTRLINGLLGLGASSEASSGAAGGQSVLPSHVTATALPPVWLVRGAAAMIRVDLQGRAEPLADLDLLASGLADPEQTQYCVLSHPAQVLAQMDIIDTPGTSDPNMAPETWQRMLAYADAVVWCTNATQAWRQSEKAVWQAMPARLRRNATLVVTHADLLTGAGMTGRVLQRVEREASACFETFVMASLFERMDLERIAAHLRNLCGFLRLEGAANPLPGDFAAIHPVRVVVATGTPAPTSAVSRPASPASLPPARPDPADSPASVGLAAPDAAAPVPAGDIAPRRSAGATVLHMLRHRRPATDVAQPMAAPASQDAALGGSAPKGMARLLWEELSAGTDRTDPDAVLAAVEHLLSRLDARQAAGGTVAAQERVASPTGKAE